MTHVLTREIPNECSIVVLGDEDFGDLATVRRTVHMVIAYNVIRLHTRLRPGAVDAATEHLCANISPDDENDTKSLHLQLYDEHEEWPELMKTAVSEGSNSCRVVCLAYWNGEDEVTLAGIKAAAQAGIEMGVIPAMRSR